MRFLTDSESDAWVAGAADPTKMKHSLSIRLPAEAGQLLFLARHIAGEIAFRDQCLLRVRNSDIWPSSNNWHLYYRLRQSYADHFLIDESPGHLFLDYETEDLATFLYLAMLFGWDADLESRAHYIKGRLSHDNFLDLYSDDQTLIAEFQKMAEGAKFTVMLRS